MAQLDVAFLVDARAVFEEALVSGDVGGIDLGDLVEQIVLVVRIIEQRPVGPLQAIEWHDGDELDILGHVVARKRPEFAKAVGIGDDGRPAVEGEGPGVGGPLPHVSPATRLVAALDHGGGDPCRLQPDRQRQPAESRSDDASGLAGGGHGRGGAGRGGGGGFYGRGVHELSPWTSGAPLPSRAATARRTGTGGFPERMRSLSSGDDCAA